MARETYERRQEEPYTVTLRPFTVHVKPVSTFSYFLRTMAVRKIANGQEEVPLNGLVATYGAGPCIAGLSIVRNVPYVFHYTPGETERRLPLLVEADSGIVGGGTEAIRAAHRHSGLGQFVRLEGGVTSLLAHHLPNNRIDLYHMLS